ncbi:hypothetical protein AB8O64_00990 [Streptomyces sp. QH1-20]|uniref:hypothetical protein n=1 Tax=Streptomyces sp. QH1-20 TaxID=3240934 RepID=UPI003513360E
MLPDLAEEFVLLRPCIDAVDVRGGSVDAERPQPSTAPIIVTAAAEAGRTALSREFLGPHRLIQLVAGLLPQEVTPNGDRTGPGRIRLPVAAPAPAVERTGVQCEGDEKFPSALPQRLEDVVVLAELSQERHRIHAHAKGR